MNRHAMAMSGASRRGRGGDKKRSRKQVLRAMKLVAKKVQRHGERYSTLLKESWHKTDWSEGQAAVIWKRIDRMVKAMPAAIKQAHDRIIGERVIPNEDKILSLYEPHCHVYVRGKAGADAEFGLQLLVSESAEGLIVDCHLVPDGVKPDTKLLIPALERIRAAHGPNAAKTVVTDRGFASASNSVALAEMEIEDSTLPRSPQAMAAKLKEPGERDLHQRRAQTEARIGVFKANFIGDHLPTKGLVAQQRFVAWSCLTHNLWVLGRMEVARDAVDKAA
jgi:IS5 family transposase